MSNTKNTRSQGDVPPVWFTEWTTGSFKKGLKELKQDLKQDLKQEFNPKLDLISKDVKSLTERQAETTKKLSFHEQRIGKLEDRLSQLDLKQREPNLIIHGLQLTDPGDCT